MSGSQATLYIENINGKSKIMVFSKKENNRFTI